MAIEEMLKLVSMYGFPMVLSVYLIIKLESLLRSITEVNARLTNGILKDICEIKESINHIQINMAKVKCWQDQFDDE
jgi:hypothetical protein